MLSRREPQGRSLRRQAVAATPGILRELLLPVVFAGLLGALLAACGDDDEDGASVDGRTLTATAALRTPTAQRTPTPTPTLSCLCQGPLYLEVAPAIIGATTGGTVRVRAFAFDDRQQPVDGVQLLFDHAPKVGTLSPAMAVTRSVGNDRGVAEVEIVVPPGAAPGRVTVSAAHLGGSSSASFVIAAGASARIVRRIAVTAAPADCSTHPGRLLEVRATVFDYDDRPLPAIRVLFRAERGTFVGGPQSSDLVAMVSTTDAQGVAVNYLSIEPDAPPCAASPCTASATAGGVTGSVEIPPAADDLPALTCTPAPTSIATPVPAGLELSSHTAAPGERITVTARLRTHGSELAGFENEIHFGPPLRIARRTNGGPDCQDNADETGNPVHFAFQPPGCRDRECTAVKALAFSFQLALFPEDAVVYSCTVEVDEDAPAGIYPLRNGAALAATPDGIAARLVARDGRVRVVEVDGTPRPTYTHAPTTSPTPTRIRPRTRTPNPDPARLRVGSATVHAGDEITLAVTLDTHGETISGTENMIELVPEVRIAAKANGRPDCTVNPDIDRNATLFSFRPTGCAASSACTAIKAIVLSFHNLDPLPDGAQLYSCRIAVAADAAPGRYPLRVTESLASNPRGVAVELAGVDGEVTVVAR